MAWYWIVAIALGLATASACFGAVLMSLLTMGKISDMQEEVDAELESRKRMANTIVSLQREIARDQLMDVDRADAAEMER